MSFDRQATRTKASLDENRYARLWHEIVNADEEENHYRKAIVQSITAKDRPIVSSEKSPTHADLIERSMIEGNADKQQRRLQSSLLTSDYSSHIDRLLQNADNDWVFEKLLEKFENIRTRKANRLIRSSSNQFDETDYGVERIIERRYYVKKPTSGSKRNQMTSTSDLTSHGKKHRQLSGISSASGLTESCSGCSTPTYVESLRNQSKTLRDEIIDLRQEIEQLHTTQEEFFHELKTQFHAKPVSQNFAPSTAAANNRPTSLTTNQRKGSVSTASHSSSSSKSQETSRQTTPTSEFTAKPSAVKSLPASAIPAAPPISEFLANKNPSLAPIPPATGTVNSQTPVAPSVPPINPNGNSRSAFAPLIPTTNTNTNVGNPSAARLPPGNASGNLKTSPTPPVHTYVNVPSPSISSVSTIGSSIKPHNPPVAPLPSTNNSKPSSISSTPHLNPYVNVRNSSVSSLSTVNSNVNSRNASVVASVPMNANNNSKKSSVASTPLSHPYVNVVNPSVGPMPPVSTYGNGTNPLVTSTPTANTTVNQRISSGVPTMSAQGTLTRPPIYENEPTPKRVLSPRSQIVASSASIQDLSDSSSESLTPTPLPSTNSKISKVLTMSLRDNEMQALTQYSSQLASSGFGPSVGPVITNPNTSSIFWDSVDEYIHQSGVRNAVTGLPPIPPANRDNRLGLNNSTTRQLDKYDLEIKPHEVIESSVPFLMPPWDSIP